MSLRVCASDTIPLSAADALMDTLEELHQVYSAMAEDSELGETPDLTYPKERFTRDIEARTVAASNLYSTVVEFGNIDWLLGECNGATTEGSDDSQTLQTSLMTVKWDEINKFDQKLMLEARRLERVKLAISEPKEWSDVVSFLFLSVY